VIEIDLVILILMYPFLPWLMKLPGFNLRHFIVLFHSLFMNCKCSCINYTALKHTLYSNHHKMISQSPCSIYQTEIHMHIAYSNYTSKSHKYKAKLFVQAAILIVDGLRGTETDLFAWLPSSWSFRHAGALDRGIFIIHLRYNLMFSIFRVSKSR